MKSKELKIKISHTHSLILTLSIHTITITCTCCCDETKGIQDQDFSCSFSDSLILTLVLSLIPACRWDAMFLGAGAMFGGRRGEDGAGQLIGYVLQMIGRILLNFTMGFVGAFFYFIYALFNLVFSYEPDAITGGIFFFVAFFAAGSMIAAVIFGMYAGTAATVGGIAYIAIKQRNAQIEYNRRNPERLRGGRQQQYGGGGRRPHYE